YGTFLALADKNDINIKICDYDLDKENVVERDCEINIFLNDIKKTEIGEKNIAVLKISESIRYKLKSPKLLRTIETFRSRAEDFFSTVSQFHLPCVRAYYNGANVYMLPTFITAMLTCVNINYKYFAGVRDPVEILNKYRSRGFGTLLN